MDYIFTFRRLLAPVLIRVIYYVGAALIVIGAIFDIFGVDRVGSTVAAVQVDQYGVPLSMSPIVVLIALPFALILWRVWCELWIVIFQIDERLGDIRDSLTGK